MTPEKEAAIITLRGQWYAMKCTWKTEYWNMLNFTLKEQKHDPVTCQRCQLERYIESLENER